MDTLHMNYSRRNKQVFYIAIRSNTADVMRKRVCVLTIAAVRAPVGRHGAVAGEALPLLQTHPLMMTRVLRTGAAGSCTHTHTHIR